MLQATKTPTWRSDAYRVPGPIRWAGRSPELYLSVLGRFFSTGRFVFQQVSPTFSVHVVASGRGEMTSRGKTYDVGPGDLFTFFPGQHYDYHDFPKSPWRYTWITFEGPHARAALKQLGLTQASPLRRGFDFNAIEPLFDELCRVYVRPTVTPASAIAAAWRLIDALSATQNGESQPRGIAESARFMIDRHAMEIVTIDELAQQLNVSRSALFRHFRAAYAVSPKQYLDSVRLERASRLLRRSNAPLKQIATACGYTSSRYFIRAFTKHFRQTPGAWRLDGPSHSETS